MGVDEKCIMKGLTFDKFLNFILVSVVCLNYCNQLRASGTDGINIQITE